MTPCPHPGCGSRVTPAGYCQRSGRRVDPATGQHAGVARPPGPRREQATAPAAAAVLLPPPEKDHDPLVLPEVRPVAARPDGTYDTGRLRSLGLGPDRMLAGQYRLIRSIGYGGMGEVHLAEDTRLENRPVAVKFLHQQHDEDDGDPPGGRREVRLNEKAMRSERQELVALNHPDLIRVFNYGSHDPAGEFLVLEYANGLTLEDVRVRVVNDPGAFGGVRFHEFVLSYGIRILNALSYLHQQKGKVYGDLKPHNVMHCGTEIKIVDVGSVRQERAEGPVTPGYFAPGVGPDGESRFQDDLFSLGVTLRELSAAAPPAQGLGPESLRRALDRATHADRRARFATADEMALQLRGVLRELRSLRTSQESFEPSPVFVQSAHALDGAIGSPPPLGHWASGAPPAPLGPVPPEPGEMACGLPVPKPDPQDRNAPRLGRLAEDDATALLQRTSGWEPSAELHLLRCRLYLALAVAAGDTRPLRRAYAEISRARRFIAPGWAPYDWRIDWHLGLLALAAGNTDGAGLRFDAIYDAIPGEYAPKIALGYCAERRREWPQALRLYDAVRRRNHSLGGAAFGCARVLLAAANDVPGGGTGTEGGTGTAGTADRGEGLAGALAALELVPAHSRHLTAARTAIVRIKAARARNSPPDDDALKDALHRLGPLFHEHGLTDHRGRQRLETELWETVIARVPHRPLAEFTAALDSRLAAPESSQELAEMLSLLYRGLADQARRSDLPDSNEIAEALIDRANSVRPLGFRHDRRHPWLGKAHRQRIRDRLSPRSSSK
ncbi:serine/threonine protein kinase [Streptomyces sp. NBC_01306]|uniref:serine/threonine protein kinase n=1 Tax=Streptomyces sp. NBC_01306 TaxID=2903819 RepID=UPI0022521C1E|nr:serine/threonine protein kinase [Streptomyces sp. NBC_01306]MCX4723921.1 protein kinase [Streptomyces sp. NBC_01306]